MESSLYLGNRRNRKVLTRTSRLLLSLLVCSFLFGSPLTFIWGGCVTTSSQVERMQKSSKLILLRNFKKFKGRHAKPDLKSVVNKLITFFRYSNNASMSLRRLLYVLFIIIILIVITIETII